ncbi:MAG: alpha/beta fold hydrolase [Thermoleophilia bacterium]
MSITSTVSMTKNSNPALVLVHGLGSAGTIWKSLIPALEKDFTVYSIDLPGHGEARLGAEFSLKKFHTYALKIGPMGLDPFAAELANWDGK